MLGSWQCAGADLALAAQVGLGKVQVWAISFGQIRDLWVPMLVLAISLFTAVAAGYQVLTSPAWYTPPAAQPGSGGTGCTLFRSCTLASWWPDGLLSRQGCLRPVSCAP